MINRIIISFLFIELFLACFLAFNNIHYVELGTPFRAFISSCNSELQMISFTIPDIPLLDFWEEGEWWMFVLNFLIYVYNAVVGIINFLILVLNTIIKLAQFLFIVLRRFRELRDALFNSPPPNIIPTNELFNVI